MDFERYARIPSRFHMESDIARKEALHGLVCMAYMVCTRVGALLLNVAHTRSALLTRLFPLDSQFR